ncbi:unnamed protein product [Discosporangium mesarthrocarpum]
MFKTIARCVFFIVALTGVMGFVPATPKLSNTVARAAAPMRMGLAQDVQKAANVASVALLTAAPALATEGTGEALGIENSNLLFLPLVTLVGINIIYLQWAKNEPEGDFFSEYDQRR